MEGPEKIDADPVEKRALLQEDVVHELSPKREAVSPEPVSSNANPDDDKEQNFNRFLYDFSPSVLTPDLKNFHLTSHIDPNDSQKQKSLQKRRRIVNLSDEFDETSDSEEDAAKLDLPPSPVEVDIPNNVVSPKADSCDEDPSLPKLTPESIEAFAKHDRPGPKSKKASTRMLKEFQARALLQSAIVIPAAIDSKKRKIRILDSDGEEEAHGVNHVDDIGLTEDNHFSDVQTIKEEIAIKTEILDDGTDVSAFPIEPATGEGVECDVPVEGMCMALDINVGECDEAEEAEHEGDNEQLDEHSDNGSKSDDTFNDSYQSGEHHRDSGNSSDRGEQPQTSKDWFDRKSSPEKPNSSDEEYIPNEVYFGTPDPKDLVRNLARGRGSRGRARGRPPSHQTLMRRQTEDLEPPIPKPRGRPRGSGRRGRPPTRARFVDDRSFSSGSTSSAQSSSGDEEPCEEPSKPNNSSSHTPQLQTNSCMNNVLSKPKTKSRFLDKSSKIPDSIYFGEVDVPLHVLHSYGNTSDESEPENCFKQYQHIRPRGGLTQGPSTRGRGRGRPPGSTIAARSAAVQSTPSKRGRKPGRTTAESFLKHMKKCYRAAGLKRPRFKEGCRSAQNRAEKILDLLHEHGLVGEPTIAACRQLKKEIVTHEEIRDLDPNLIIQSEGRTRRQSARAATHRSYTYDDPDPDPPAAPKFNPIIDSESDSD